MNRTTSIMMADKDRVGALVQQLQSTPSLGLPELLAHWRSCEPEQWSVNVNIYQLLGGHFLKLGEALLAFDVISDGLKYFPKNVRLRQLLGHALSRSGAFKSANGILSELRTEGSVDEETLGMLARTHKDFAFSTKEPLERSRHLRLASQIYGEAYQLSGGHWSGINAATMALLSGDEETAKSISKKVQTQCLAEQKINTAGDYWRLATLGEAALILGDWRQAEDWYANAAQAAGGRFGDIHSSRRNARLILQYWDVDPAQIIRWLKIPNVAVFIGHMLDRPSRPSPRFPPHLETKIAAEICERIKKLEVRFGYASAACGSDILFLEAMLACGGEIQIVLPYEKEQFVRDSVGFAGDEWTTRMEHVLGRATHITVASRQGLGASGISHDYANQVMLGLASILARQLETKLMPLAVWNGQTGDGHGGTASAIELWRGLGLPVEVIELNTPVSPQQVQSANIEIAPASPPSAPAHGEPTQFNSRIMAVLFADAVGFSKLTELEIPRFIKHFLGAIAGLIARSPNQPVAKNTWGDGLYFVFASVNEAGLFALELCDLVSTTNWKEFGLINGLGLRIALHAGPVYECEDPITGQHTCTGTHVSRAARIEPIAPPGHIYASEAFAALAAIQPENRLICDYVGQTPLAKGYGTFPTYHVRRI